MYRLAVRTSRRAVRNACIVNRTDSLRAVANRTRVQAVVLRSPGGWMREGVSLGYEAHPSCHGGRRNSLLVSPAVPEPGLEV
jgi:hypothetical protein